MKKTGEFLFTLQREAKGLEDLGRYHIQAWQIVDQNETNYYVTKACEMDTVSFPKNGITSWGKFFFSYDEAAKYIQENR